MLLYMLYTDSSSSLLPLWSYSVPFLPWVRFGLSPLPSFLEPSHGHYPQPPSCFGLQVDTWISQLETKMDWQPRGWHWGRGSIDSWCHPSRHHPFWPIQCQHFPTCIQMRAWQQWPVPPLPGTIVSDFTVSPWESLQWDSTEWYLAWLCLLEV